MQNIIYNIKINLIIYFYIIKSKFLSYFFFSNKNISTKIKIKHILIIELISKTINIHNKNILKHNSYKLIYRNIFYKLFLYNYIFRDKNNVYCNNLHLSPSQINNINKELNKGNGVIFISYHFFNHFSLPLSLQNHFPKINTVIKDNITDYLNNASFNNNINCINITEDNLFFKLKDKLQNNEIVIIYIDVEPSNLSKTDTLKLFDSDIKIARNIAFALAYQTKATILPALNNCKSILSNNILIFDHIKYNNTDTYEQFKNNSISIISNILENQLKQNPWNWQKWLLFMNKLNINIENKNNIVKSKRFKIKFTNRAKSEILIFNLSPFTLQKIDFSKSKYTCNKKTK